MASRRRDKGKLEALRKRNLLHARAAEVSDPLFADNLFFDPHDALQVKYEMLRRTREDGHSVAEAARSFGFSRPSFYQARAAFDRAGIAGLLPEKRGPRRAHKLAEPVLELLRAAVAADPGSSAAQLAERVRERFGVSIHPRSIERALARSEKKTP
jgi:transposase